MATSSEVRAAAIARGRVLKRVNALTAILCGTVPAVLLNVLFRTSPGKWLAGFAVGFVWANFFEYAYHRFFLHLPGTFLAHKHLEHHASVGTPTEAEHLNLGGSPIWVSLLFAVNAVPVVIVESLLRLSVAPGMLVAFTTYFVVTEELHWRIHLGEWLPPGLEAARNHHLTHHAQPNARFNIFLPLWDRLLATWGGNFGDDRESGDRKCSSYKQSKDDEMWFAPGFAPRKRGNRLAARNPVTNGITAPKADKQRFCPAGRCCANWFQARRQAERRRRRAW